MSKKLLTKDEVLKLVRTAKTEFVKLLAQTAYDAFVRLEEVQERQALFAGAVKDQTKIDELRDELRRAQEKLAAMEVSSPPVVIILHRDGFVEVFAEAYFRVHFVCRPDLGRSLEDAADDYVLSQLPINHRALIETDRGKRIAFGSTKGCMNLTSWNYAKLMREKIAGAWVARLTNEPIGETA